MTVRPKWAWALGGLLMAVAYTLRAADPSPLATKQQEFNANVIAHVNKYCIECHGPKKQSGSVSFHQFKTPADVVKDRATWDTAIERIRAHEMPPKSKPQPAEAERKEMLAWLEGELSTATCDLKVNPGRVTLRRLNRVEYANTVRELFGADFQPAEGFPLDDVGYGFDNIGDVLSLSPLLMEKYLAAADDVLDKVFARDQKVKTNITHYQARNPNLVVTGRNVFLPGDRIRQLYGGDMSIKYKAEYPGDYKVVLRAYGHPLFGENPKIAFRAAGKSQKPIEIRPPKGDAPPKAERGASNYEATFTLPAGEHRIGFEFRNPKSDPKQTDPKLKDRSLVIVSMEISGPLKPPPAEPTESYKRLMIAQPGPELENADAAARVLRPFVRRAYRRPPTDAEIRSLVDLHLLAEEKGDGFDGGIKLALKAVLVSPNFLFKVENDPPNAVAGQAYPINNLELATRLSYFLWSSLPDDELLGLAERGRLKEPATLEAQVRRMLRDPRSRALADNFAGQWLQVRNLKSTPIDAKTFPTYDDALRNAMIEETLRFFDAVVREDRSVLEFLDADYTYVNEKLAKHYGMTGVNGIDFRKVSLAGTQRAGILTHASILTVTSNATRTSPVKRGKFILENILGVTIPPPPPDVPDLDDDGKELKGSLRERLEQHRTNPGCASCHDRMDPPGFAFENFDAIGKWREKDGKHAIDPSGKLPDGKEFKNAADLRRILMDKQEAFRKTLADRLLTYALGRGLDHQDRCVTDDIAKKVAEGGNRFSTLVLAVVTSDPFQKRTAKGPR